MLFPEYETEIFWLPTANEGGIVKLIEPDSSVPVRAVNPGPDMVTDPVAIPNDPETETVTLRGAESPIVVATGVTVTVGRACSV